MANHRMFSYRIANSAKFLQMPAETQLLYFHLVLRADDDGVVESYPIIKMLGLPIDNFKVLEAKDYIKQINEDQVVIINDWLEHNKIRADRKVNSLYKPLLDNLGVKTLEPKPRADVIDNTKRLGGLSTDNQRTAQVKLSKVKLINTSCDLFDEFWNLYDKKVGKEKCIKKWKKLCLKDKRAILEYIPKYKEAQPNKRYRKNPETFLNNKSWNDELVVCDEREPLQEVGNLKFYSNEEILKAEKKGLIKFIKNKWQLK